jgi:hypothetical protein
MDSSVESIGYRGVVKTGVYFAPQTMLQGYCHCDGAEGGGRNPSFARKRRLIPTGLIL